MLYCRWQRHYRRGDHQGSITGLIDAAGTFAEENYDAWSRRRNSQDRTYDNVPVLQLLHSGYTFHEHLNEFRHIMNGRAYDPFVGRFLNPDPVIQNPTNETLRMEITNIFVITFAIT